MEATPKAEAEVMTTSGPVAHFRDDFYRDGFRIIMLSLGMMIAAIGLLIIVSLYFFFHQVLPITFPVYEGWRVQSAVPIDRPYLRTADLLQWISQTLPAVLTIDFFNYDQQLKKATPYFTANGWTKFMELTNTSMNHDEIVKNKVFVQSQAAGAPVILNQGIVEGRHGWWVQMPIDVRYSSVDGNNRVTRLIIQALVVRVPTLDNLEGAVIDNLIVKQG